MCFKHRLSHLKKFCFLKIFRKKSFCFLTPNFRTDSEHVVIAGGSSFLGLNLARDLQERGCRVTLLSRHPPKGSGWDIDVAWKCAFS